MMREKKTESAKRMLDKYNSGTCTNDEARLVEAWFNHLAKLAKDIPDAEGLDAIGHEIWARLPKYPETVKRKLWPRVAAVAAVITAIVCLGLLFRHLPRESEHLSVRKQDSISPGTYGATLRLANGKTIALRGLKNGVFAKESGININKTEQGTLVYQINGASASAAATNTLTTSKGETFKVDLPDGSSVWLNAASSLTYATNIGTAELRTVTLNGEAYFKVARDINHPFVVKTNHQEIKVLGTEFNVSSYANDDFETTTLLHGKIRMSTPVTNSILNPGEQGIVRADKINISTVNTYVATGWKNNEFVFASQDIKDIMKLIERWYDVKVEYEGEVTSDKISGSISRFADISSVLNILRATGTVKIKINGNKIIVSDVRNKAA